MKKYSQTEIHVFSKDHININFLQTCEGNQGNGNQLCMPPNQSTGGWKYTIKYILSIH